IRCAIEEGVRGPGVGCEPTQRGRLRRPMGEEQNGADQRPGDRNREGDPTADGQSGLARRRVHCSELLRGSVLGRGSSFGFPSEGLGATSGFGRLGSLDGRGGAGSVALVDLPGASACAPGAGLGAGFALAPGGSGAAGLTTLGRGGLSPSTGGAAERTTEGGVDPGAVDLAAAGRDGPRTSPSLAGGGLAADLAGEGSWPAPSWPSLGLSGAAAGGEVSLGGGS